MASLIDYLSLDLNKKVSIIFISIITVITIIDSTIPEFYTYSDINVSMESNTSVFIWFSAIFAVISVILLFTVRKNIPKSIFGLPIEQRYLHGIIFGAQIMIIAILVAIIFQINQMNFYNIYFLNASTYISHFFALFFLIFLVFMFVKWSRSKRNLTMILYTVSFSLLSLTIITSMIYLEYQFSSSISDERKPYSIYSYLVRQEVTGYTEYLKNIYDILYLSSFIAIWIATLNLLKQYRYRLGKIRYLILVSIPLIYYLFPFEDYFTDLLSPIIVVSPITLGVIYIAIFSATKQVGALLFSLSFLTASSLIANRTARKSVLISAIGIAIIFGSIEITTLQYRLYPPFGLITEAFMQLGAYLLFIGIVTSATTVSRDAELRKDFYKSAKSQLTLLRAIGVTQMQDELMKKFKSVEKRTRQIETNEQSYLEEEDVKKIVRDVLNELYSKTKDSATNRESGKVDE